MQRVIHYTRRHDDAEKLSLSVSLLLMFIYRNRCTSIFWQGDEGRETILLTHMGAPQMAQELSKLCLKRKLKSRIQNSQDQIYIEFTYQQKSAFMMIEADAGAYIEY